MKLSEARISAAATALLAAEIRAAGGREVSFVADLDEAGVVTTVRAVARGTVQMVLALPGAARQGQMMLHNHPSGELEPSEPDLAVAARLHDAGVGFGIIDNTGRRLYVVVEVPRGRTIERLDPYAVVATLGEDGPVARVLGQYEDRQSQRDMAAYIADGYNDGGVLVLEAGTGVGKSFAYLVPALAWSRVNGERTVISTNTINLQEQLVGKDLPMLREALAEDGWAPKFALLKGWRNYLCLSRLHHATGAQQSLLEPERQDELVSLAEWASRTADGTLSDLAVHPTTAVWDEVSAEAEACLNAGVAAWQAGQLDVAIKHLKRGVELDPLAFRLHFHLGLLYGKKGRVYEAIAELEAAAAQNDKHFPVLKNLAVLSQKAGFKTKAMTAWEKASHVAPDEGTRATIRGHIETLK